jgi:hypothetical protein
MTTSTSITNERTMSDTNTTAEEKSTSGELTKVANALAKAETVLDPRPPA